MTLRVAGTLPGIAALAFPRWPRSTTRCTMSVYRRVAMQRTPHGMGHMFSLPFLHALHCARPPLTPCPPPHCPPAACGLPLMYRAPLKGQGALLQRSGSMPLRLPPPAYRLPSALIEAYVVSACAAVARLLQQSRLGRKKERKTAMAPRRQRGAWPHAYRYDIGIPTYIRALQLCVGCSCPRGVARRAWPPGGHGGRVRFVAELAIGGSRSRGASYMCADT